MNGWFFGSGATRSRAEVTEAEVLASSRLACGDWLLERGGAQTPRAIGSDGFDSCDDAESAEADARCARKAQKEVTRDGGRLTAAENAWD